MLTKRVTGQNIVNNHKTDLDLNLYIESINYSKNYMVSMAL